MQILIKSFNRPYYLDRCLSSIQKFVVGYQKVLIMDDGTPQKYLEIIKQKFPFVEVVYAEHYHEKEDFILKKSNHFLSIIPSKLWHQCASETTDYFVMLEDDMWFIDYINLNEINQTLETNHIEMLKLFWLGNSKLINYQDLKNENIIELCQPKLSIFNDFYFHWIYRRLQRLNRIKTFLGLYKKDQLLDYYSIYGVAGMIFNKEYYLALWSNNQLKVDEMQQLKNGISYIKTKGKYPVAKTVNEVLKTGFISAATNSNKEHYESQLDMFLFNQLINDFWSKNELDVLENFPNDFSKDYIFEKLKSHNLLLAEKWLNWHTEFKQQYIKLGCEI